MKEKSIEFIASKKIEYDAFEPPVPTSKVLPEWYKKQNKYVGNKLKVDSIGNYNHTIKACMPVFDMITAGYVIKLPCDIFFEKDETGNIYSVWSTSLIKCVETHSIEQVSKFPIPDGYNPNPLKFVQPWIIKTPPGYSTLFMSPAFQTDSPFYMMPGIVDTDKHPLPVNFPFLIDNDFEGIVEAGTPIMQIIPFKRDSWNSSISYDKNDDGMRVFEKAKTKLGNRYKTFYRSNKVWK